MASNNVRLTVARNIGVGGSRDIGSLIKSKIPEDSLLFNPSFWLNAEAQLKKLPEPQGYYLCQDKETKDICLCKEKSLLNFF